ncbi:MAG: preprotein translocase subunit SecE [Anaerolineae bacterium]|nr:preprotein translocase subunit SecE [Anaerolineae bacterium]
MRKESGLTRYFRETRAELRKVRWPTRDDAITMTQLVLAVTFAMAIFLGLADYFFSWLLRGVVSQNWLFIILGVVIVVALLVSAYLIGQGEEV